MISDGERSPLIKRRPWWSPSGETRLDDRAPRRGCVASD